MPLSPWITARAWLLAPLLALVLLAWSHGERSRHATQLSALAGGDQVATDETSPTGLARGVRRLVLTEQRIEGMHWLLQTEQMVASGDWRLRRVDFDNAPHGRPVASSAPYRAWLALVARTDAALTGRPIGAAVERAALWADPLLHALLVIGLAWGLARWFGITAAAVGAVAGATLFPLAASFLPGQPAAHALSILLAAASVLPVVAALWHPTRRRRRWILAGVAGGLGLWVDGDAHLPILAGLVAGGVVAAWVARGAAAVAWRTWAAAGAGACLVAWFLEYAPDALRLEGGALRGSLPGLALAWLGTGLAVARLTLAIRDGRPAWRGAGIVEAIVAVLALAGGVFLVSRGGASWFAASDVAARLSDLPGGVAAESLAAWLGRDGVSAALVVTVLPLVVALGVVVAWWLRGRQTTAAAARAAIALAAVVVLVATAGASVHLRHWATVEVLAIVLAAPVIAAVGGVLARWAATIATALCVLPALHLVVPPRAQAIARGEVTPAEVQGLIERDLAWWLAAQAPEPDAVVLAPPELTVALAHHGRLRGLGTPYLENEDGFRVALRIAAATSADEAQALVESRGVRYIILPSWDGFMDEYARLGSNQPEYSLVGLLHQWLPPRWLRPIAYQMPAVAGFEGEAVVVFEVVELQENVVALARLAEYFVETGRGGLAVALAANLEQAFPTEPAAHVARAQVAAARRDVAAFREAVEALLPLIEDGSTEVLTWDRRVAMAVVLAQARRTDLARDELVRCLDEMDDYALRTLSNLTLHRLHGLLKTFDLEFADPDLRRLALELLPPDLRPPP